MSGVRIHRWVRRAEEPTTRVIQAPCSVVVGYMGRPEGGGRCEDAALVIELGERSLVLAVADGMGSGARADDASATIVDCLAARAESIAGESASRIEVLDAIEEASATIRGWGVGAATTVMVVEIDDDHYRTYHVGDSESLVTGQRGRLKWHTISHSPVGYARASGLLAAEAALVHEERHLVDSMVGLEGMRVDLGERRRFSRRDTLLLATDGLFDNLSVGEIVDTIRKGPIETAAETLVSRAVVRMIDEAKEAPGKPDDLAFILFRPSARSSRMDQA